MGKGSTSPAIKRSIIENELIEEFHWLPQDVDKIPYDKLQTMFIIKRQQRESAHQKNVLAEQAMQQSAGTSNGRGQQKRIQVTQY